MLKRERFTMVEMLVVIGILVLLAGLVYPVMKMVWAKNAAAKTRERMGRIDAAMEAYYKAKGYYLPNPPAATPPNYNVDACRMTVAEMNELGLDLPTLGGYVIDYWKKPICFRCPGVMNPQRYDLWSSGPDKVTGGGQNDVRQALTRGETDDLTNWKGR